MEQSRIRFVNSPLNKIDKGFAMMLAITYYLGVIDEDGLTIIR